jgi:hypothetical protein
LSINDATVEEGSKAVFTVSLSGASEEALEITLATSVTDPLTAEAGDIDPANLVVTYNDGTNDVVLTAVDGKYTVPAGVTVLTVKVPTVGDAVYEGAETFTLSANVTQAYVTDTDIECCGCGRCVGGQLRGVHCEPGQGAGGEHGD